MIASAIALRTTAVRASEPTEREEILKAAQGLFDAMFARDTAQLHQLFTVDGRLISTWLRSGKPVARNLSVADFSKMVVATKEPYRERMIEPQVLVDGDVALVWGKYDFHVGARLTNCGINAVQMLRTADGWKISQVTSTIITEGCIERE
jgi:ketosteroid isomerase-like protein